MQKTFKLDTDEYDVIHPSAVEASKHVTEMFERLGKPQNPFSKTGEKMMNIIIAVWEDLYPLQAKQWFEERAEHKRNEMTIKEQVKKKTGRNLASIPLPVYKMMKAVFPSYKMDKREDFMKLVKRYPIFSLPNKV